MGNIAVNRRCSLSPVSLGGLVDCGLARAHYVDQLPASLPSGILNLRFQPAIDKAYWALLHELISVSVSRPLPHQVFYF